MSYLIFKEFIENKTENIGFWIFNKKEECLGKIEKTRVGAWQSYYLYLYPDCYLSASCLDEVREKIKELNRTKNKGLIKNEDKINNSTKEENQ